MANNITQDDIQSIIRNGVPMVNRPTVPMPTNSNFRPPFLSPNPTPFPQAAYTVPDSIKKIFSSLFTTKAGRKQLKKILDPIVNPEQPEVIKLGDSKRLHVVKSGKTALQSFLEGFLKSLDQADDMPERKTIDVPKIHSSVKPSYGSGNNPRIPESVLKMFSNQASSMPNGIR